MESCSGRVLESLLVTSPNSEEPIPIPQQECFMKNIKKQTLPVSMSSRFTLFLLCCAAGTQLLGQGSPSLPMPLVAIRQLELGRCYLNDQDLSHGEKALLTVHDHFFPPSLSSCAAPCPMLLQSPACMVAASRAEELVSHHSGICWILLEASFLWNRLCEVKNVTSAFPKEGRGISYGIFKAFLVSYNAIISI